jgi:hypothetical protein
MSSFPYVQLATHIANVNSALADNPGDWCGATLSRLSCDTIAQVVSFIPHELVRRRGRTLRFVCLQMRPDAEAFFPYPRVFELSEVRESQQGLICTARAEYTPHLALPQAGSLWWAERY